MVIALGIYMLIVTLAGAFALALCRAAGRDDLLAEQRDIQEEIDREVSWW